MLVQDNFETTIGSERMRLPPSSATFQRPDEIHDGRVLSKAACGFNVELTGDVVSDFAHLRLGQLAAGRPCDAAALLRAGHRQYRARTGNGGPGPAVSGTPATRAGPATP
jgi:hypothetical protein